MRHIPNRKPLARIATAAVTAALALSLAAPAMAERGGAGGVVIIQNGRDRGHYDRRDYRNYRDHRDNRRAGECPPGLARKHNGCMPPGQLRHREEYRHHEWRRGDRIHGYDYRYLRDYRRYHLRRPPHGERYVIIGNQILRVDSDTLAVIAAVGLVGALLNN